MFNALAGSEPVMLDFGGVEFNRRFPTVVADLATANETDACSLRYREVDRESIVLFLQEERSLDEEVAHVAEQLSVFVAE